MHGGIGELFGHGLPPFDGGGASGGTGGVHGEQSEPLRAEAPAFQLRRQVLGLVVHQVRVVFVVELKLIQTLEICYRIFKQNY